MAMSSPTRRGTIFPGNSNISSLGKRRTEATDRLSSSKIPKIPDFLQKSQRVRPPTLPLKANPKSQQFSTGSRFPPRQKTSASPQGFTCQRGNPWQAYYAILKEDQDGGEFTIAHKKEVQHPVVAIKRESYTDNSQIKRLTRCSHENIVSLYRAYFEEGSVYLIYECVDVSLAEIQSTPRGKLASYQIAAVCQEVLQGIRYIHNELKILHGSVRVDNVMVNRNGSVKLANIGQSMLKGTDSSQNEQKDFQALGLLMIRLMELGTSLQHPDSIELRKPEEWDEEIKDFLNKTTQSPGDVLQKDIFLQKSPDSHCLKPLVLITERSIDRFWEDCME
ncbi:hypothetical protein ABVK25_010794 [Lepraria finkii]|uniref:Protein kinase domain-containing protein n=1 Tax=Lepraria finkii TaxID=1340010 RepID=A0ABR4ATN0_9LECA